MPLILPASTTKEILKFLEIIWTESIMLHSSAKHNTFLETLFPNLGTGFRLPYLKNQNHNRSLRRISGYKWHGIPLSAGTCNWLRSLIKSTCIRGGQIYYWIVSTKVRQHATSEGLNNLISFDGVGRDWPAVIASSICQAENLSLDVA